MIWNIKGVLTKPLKYYWGIRGSMLIPMEYVEINEVRVTKSTREIQHDSYNMISLKQLIWILGMKRHNPEVLWLKTVKKELGNCHWMRFITQEWFCFYMYNMYNNNTDPFLKAKPKALYYLLGGKPSFKGWVWGLFLFFFHKIQPFKTHIIRIKQIY